MPEVVVEYRKWPATMHHRTTMIVLGADSAGTWAGSRRGATVARGDGASGTFATDAVTLFPLGRAWSARWYAHPATSGRAATYRCYVDITTPVSRTGTSLHLVDLDLDVALTWEDEVVELDEAEFARHQTALNYPEALVQQALDAFDDMRLALAEHTFPFDGSADPYLTAWFDRKGPGDLP